MSLTDTFIELAERGLVPISSSGRASATSAAKDSGNAWRMTARPMPNWPKNISRNPMPPMAVLTDKANEQHYEVPAEFYRLVLGKNSSTAVVTLMNSSAICLRRKTGPRTDLRTCPAGRRPNDPRTGMRMGFPFLRMAKRYPKARITSVSNSHSQPVISEASPGTGTGQPRDHHRRRQRLRNRRSL